MGAKPVEFHPEALAEAEAALAWYGERSSGAAEGFLTELERAVEAISEAPDRWPRSRLQALSFAAVSLSPCVPREGQVD